MNKKRIADSLIAFVLALILNNIIAIALVGRLGMFAFAVSSVMLILPASFLIKLRKEDPAQRLSLHLPEIKHFFAGVFVYVGANSISSGIIYALYSVYYKKVQSPDTQLFDYMTDAASPMLILLCIAVLPAIFEELLFRGYIRTAFGDGKKRAILAITVSSLMFCIAHGSIYKVPTTLIMGIAFGYIAYKSGSVLITVILHFINNANSLISYYTLRSNNSPSSMVFILKDSSYYYMAALVFVAGSFLVFIGVRLFAEKRMRLLYKVIISILVILLCGGCMLGLANNESEVLLNKYNNHPVSDGELVEEKLVLEKNSMCIIQGIFNCSEGVDCRFSIYNEEGENVYDGAEEAGSLLLDKGEYTVRIEFSVDKGTQKTDAAYSIMIIGFGEYSTTAS